MYVSLKFVEEGLVCNEVVVGWEVADYGGGL